MKKKLFAILTTLVVIITMLPASVLAVETDPITGFAVNSQAVYMVNNESGMVIYEKNADAAVYPASLTKIMTAVIAI